MSVESWTYILSVFDRVLDCPVEQRTALLQRICDDPDVRAEVEALLEAEAKSGDFLESGAAEAGATLIAGDIEEDSEIGDHVGPYRIVRRLGCGGMSVVYEAERDDGQYTQRVALKLLPRYFNTKERVARFRTERQILARLDHPNIAHLFDGGVTETGQPYLVMEYVDGVPITEYCTRHSCGLDKRIQLLRTVSGAVQHAHQNLIVHRDLKPANILVTPEGQVKLLDFGIAKLLNHTKEADSAPITRAGERLMTPEYAAPEQVEGGTVTTATDTYQLGVVAYELLTGQLPFQNPDNQLSRLEQAIVHETPASPSTTISDADEGVLPVCASEWCSYLQGDLDTILLKSLRKEPAARYDSAQAFANDLTRYQRNQPVAARPPTWTYRATKFVQRYRHSVAISAVAVALLVGLMAALNYQRAIALEERDRAQQQTEKAEHVSDFLIDLFEAGDPAKARGEEVTARTLLDRGHERVDLLEEQPGVQAHMLVAVGRIYRRLGAYDEARPLLERAVALHHRQNEQPHPETARSLERLGMLYADLDAFAPAEDTLRSALAIWDALDPPQPIGRASTQNRLAYVLRRQGDYEQAELLYRANLAVRRIELGDSHPETLASKKSLGIVLHNQAQYTEAEQIYRAVLDRRRDLLGPKHPHLATSLNSLGALYVNQGRFDEARSLLEEALAIRQDVFGQTHPSVAMTMNNLAMAYRDEGDLDTARALFHEALSMRRSLYDTDHASIAMTLHELGDLSLHTEQPNEARAYFNEALAIFVRTLSEDHSFVARTRLGLGRALQELGDTTQALQFVDAGFERIKEIHPNASIERALANVHRGVVASEYENRQVADSLLTAGYAVLNTLESTPSIRQTYAREQLQALQAHHTSVRLTDQR